MTGPVTLPGLCREQLLRILLSFSVVLDLLFFNYHWKKRREKRKEYIKGALSGLKHFLATRNPLKVMKKVFYFTLQALFVLKVLKFLT